jgi:plasmid stabilization system protein ParE
MSAYILSEDASFDLDDIWEYIAQDNLDAADRWPGKLFDAFDAVGRSPGIGHKREDPCLVLSGGCISDHLPVNWSNRSHHRYNPGHSKHPLFLETPVPCFTLIPLP